MWRAKGAIPLGLVAFVCCATQGERGTASMGPPRVTGGMGDLSRGKLSIERHFGVSSSQFARLADPAVVTLPVVTTLPAALSNARDL